MSLTLVCCEGRHDHALLVKLLQALAWRKVEPQAEDPEYIRARLPRPRQLKGRLAFQLDRLPDFLRRGQGWLVIEARGSVEQVLGDATDALIEQIGAPLTSVGLFVDCDTSVQARVQRAQQVFGHRIATSITASAVMAGKPGNPRLGLWVSPDNNRCGTLDDLLLESITIARPTLSTAAATFVNDHFSSTSLGDQKKATLGIVAQQDTPASPLAGAIRTSADWLGGGPTTGPLVLLARFLEDLTRGDADHSSSAAS